MNGGLTHLDEDGAARMVDVSAKAETKREATAEGRILIAADALEAIRAGAVKKGDGKDVDHRDGNPKNNSRGNLRVRSKSANRSVY